MRDVKVRCDGCNTSLRECEVKTVVIEQEIPCDGKLEMEICSQCQHEIHTLLNKIRAKHKLRIDIEDYYVR